VKIDDILSDYHLVKAGVKQGNVTEPLLHFIYTADAPPRDATQIATFTDDTAIMSSDADPARASGRLHHHQNRLPFWPIKWKFIVHLIKFTQITFTI
jgi:hypothetical protein